jgi:hypothetical protein
MINGHIYDHMTADKQIESVFTARRWLRINIARPVYLSDKSRLIFEVFCNVKRSIMEIFEFHRTLQSPENFIILDVAPSSADS